MWWDPCKGGRESHSGTSPLFHKSYLRVVNYQFSFFHIFDIFKYLSLNLDNSYSLVFKLGNRKTEYSGSSKC